MHPRSILAIARKDALDILLNKSTLTMLVTPILLAILFVIITNLFGSKTTNILLYNPGRSNIEQVLKDYASDVKITAAGSPDEVRIAFGPDGSHRSSSYALGVVVPANFDTSLRSGSHPQLSMYINGDQVNTIQHQLLLSAITNYSRSVANPQPPATITVATINPPAQASNVLQDIGNTYAMTALLATFMTGTMLVPGLLIEEKEKKTLRMLMVSPTSFADVAVGKILVALAYQLLLAVIALAITSGFRGQVPFTILFMFLGAIFSVSLGLLAGSIFQTTSAAGSFGGLISFIYILPIFFVGAFAQLFQNNVVTQIIRILPTYYLADGAANAIQNQGAPGSIVLDVSVMLVCILILLAVATWGLRQQASIVGTI